MAEPRELNSARTHLSRAEAGYRSDDGLFHLEEGLALLQDVRAESTPEFQLVARNLAMTYARRIFQSIGALLERDRGLPEPDLEHLFKLTLIFDHGGFELPAQARDVKIGIARLLLERYLEGHPSVEKQAALEELKKIAGS
jgi:hypothetical protein